MDLLLKRYASPFIYLDELIRNKMLLSFVNEFMVIVDEENLWNLYLHRYIEISFDEWRKTITGQKVSNLKETNKKEVEATIQHAENILSHFNPEEGGG